MRKNGDIAPPSPPIGREIDIGANVMQKDGRFTNEVIIVGTFPPPVHGMAVANSRVRKMLEQEGVNVITYDTSPGTATGRLTKHLNRLLRHMMAWINLLRSRRRGGETVYLALSGGLGQLYDVVTIMICRVRKHRCVLHHHGWSYLDRKSAMMRQIVKLAGFRSHHVTLCEEMGKKLQEWYRAERVHILTNAFLLGISNDLAPHRQRGVSKVGLLSNLTTEKGVDVFLNLARVGYERGQDYKFILAGPCPTASLKKEIETAQELGYVEWVGPVYERDKIKFLQEIDVFVFPTKYKYEAEPIVLWEALSAGLPVLTTKRGCIPEQVGRAGLIIENEQVFIDEALRKLIAWKQNPALYEKASRTAYAQYQRALSTGRSMWRKLLHSVLS